jgi:hypothetical protein
MHGPAQAGCIEPTSRPPFTPTALATMPSLTTILRRTAVGAALLAFAACEGMVTGQQVFQQPLTQNEDGSFAPVRFNLTPEMNPVAVNFKGMTIAHPDESAHWNSYVANLAHRGAVVASSSFDINNPGTRDNDHGGPFAQTLFFVTVPEAGEYELSIRVSRPQEITIQQPSVEVRRNTQPPPRR